MTAAATTASSTTSAATAAAAAKILESAEGSLAGMIMHALICLTAVGLFHSCVAAIAGQNAQYQAAALAASYSKNNTQLELEEETEVEFTNGDYVQAGGHDDSGASTPSSQKQAGGGLDPSPHHGNGNVDADAEAAAYRRLGKLSKEDLIALTGKLAVLMLLNYLLLVYLPGSVVLSLVAICAIWALTLHGYLSEEVFRRKRFDRVAWLASLFFAIAMSLTAFTYHRITYQQGDVYKGPARIVGYDTSVYTNSDGESLRTNLEVNWGGDWACPRHGIGGGTSDQCQAVVQGALCQTKYDATAYANDRRRMRRRLKSSSTTSSSSSSSSSTTNSTNNTGSGNSTSSNNTISVTNGSDEATLTLAADDTVAGEEVEFADEVVDLANEEIEEVVEEADEEVEEVEEVVEEEAAEEVAEEEETVEQEQAEVEELEKEKQQLEDEITQLEEGSEVEEEEIEELEEELNYEYEDDVYASEYWDYDWDSVWGEYACEDLFDQDVNALTPFDPDTAPGSDDWPTVQIYGSCRSCEAYLMDYYTTEHFQQIQDFQTQYYIYAALSAILLAFAGLLRLREHYRPSQEKQIVLLNNEGGVVA